MRNLHSKRAPRRSWRLLHRDNALVAECSIFWTLLSSQLWNLQDTLLAPCTTANICTPLGDYIPCWLRSRLPTVGLDVSVWTDCVADSQTADDKSSVRFPVQSCRACSKQNHLKCWIWVGEQTSADCNQRSGVAYKDGRRNCRSHSGKGDWRGQGGVECTSNQIDAHGCIRLSPRYVYKADWVLIILFAGRRRLFDIISFIDVGLVNKQSQTHG